MTDSPISLGTKIAELRLHKKNLKQGDFARALQPPQHPSTVSMWENGKTHPSNELMVQIIRVLGLKRDEARDLLLSGGYPLSLLDRLRPDFSHYPETEPEKINQYLQGDLGQIPVWYLRTNATVRSFNLLSAYLFGALDISGREILADKLFNVCVFEIYARHEVFYRLSPPLESRDMLSVKPPVFRKMEEEIPRTAFDTFYRRIQESPVLRLLYEYGKLEGGEWEYTLRIKPPLSDEQHPYLVFNVEVKRVMDGDTHEGFLVISQPVGTYTIGFIQKVYSQIVEAFPGQFVQRQSQPEPRVEVSYPSFYPQVELSSLFYVIRENEALRLLVQKSVDGQFLADLLVSGAFRDLMGPAQANNAVLNVLRLFFSLTTKAYQDENDWSYRQYEKVRRYLFSEQAYDKHLDAFWRRYPPSVLESEPEDGAVQCEPLVRCRYATNVLLRLRTIGYFHRREDSYLLVFEPADTETSIVLLLFHLEKVCVSPKDVGRTPVEQYLWLLSVLKAVEYGITNGGASMWVPERAYECAKAQPFVFADGSSTLSRERQARHQVQGLVYKLSNHKNIRLKSAVLYILIGFSRIAKARYCLDLLTESVTGTVIEQIEAAPNLLPLEEFVEEGPHRHANGSLQGLLAEQEEHRI